jgi:ABC-type dipeptide/oligopeptide/nickel transport system permease subunit
MEAKGAAMTTPLAPPARAAQLHNSLWWDALRRLRRDRIATFSFVFVVTYLLMGLLCVLGILYPEHGVVHYDEAYLPPDGSHWLGTDIFGRDVLARAIHGAVTSLTVGFAGTGLSMLIGTTLGALAGYFGGKVDELIVWFYTTVDTIPYILLVVAFSMVLGSGLSTMCLVIGLTFWVSHCRVMRAEFMKHRDREYVQGAVALGAGHPRRIFFHILPNVSHLILINFSLGVVTAILSEVVLSYLGLGVEPGVPSWGIMISDAKLELSRGVWWGLAAATGFMFCLILSLTLFNDGLRDALDPKLKNK